MADCNKKAARKIAVNGSGMKKRTEDQIAKRIIIHLHHKEYWKAYIHSETENFLVISDGRFNI